MSPDPSRSSVSVELGQPEGADDNPRPTKQRRTDQACSQCRHRKQRCIRSAPSPSADLVHVVKCDRCQRLKIECSFEDAHGNDIEDRTAIEATPSGTSGRVEQLLAGLQESLMEHAARMARVEQLVNQHSQAMNPQSDLAPDRSSSSAIQAPDSNFLPPQYDDPSEVDPSFSLSTVEIGAPMSTIRSLRSQLARDDGRGLNMPEEPRVLATRARIYEKRLPMWDPIVQGHLTEEAAKQAINIFFDHCHAHAPVMDEQTRPASMELRYTCPVLFLAICTTACRFWPSHQQASSTVRTLHPRYPALTALFDIAISRLLLNPSPTDVTLDSIRALLLYAQWMPLSSQSDQTEQSLLPQSRYSDISAWAVLGLAMRYAAYLGLDRQAVAAFQDSRPIQSSDMSRLRVWHNLLTCDCNLMLTSGLPATLDPGPAAKVASAFGSNPLAQQPADLRVSALIELVVIAHRASTTKDGQLSIGRLKKVNTELDDWEATWTPRLMNTEAQYCSLPFTSVRWYRLAINSKSIGPLLASPDSIPASSRISLLGALEAALTSCCRILMSVTDRAGRVVWHLEAQDTSSFGGVNQFRVDPAVVSRLVFSVDYVWISLTFAAVFLVICYLEGAIDETLQIVSFTSAPRAAPTPARDESLLARLLTLACDLFDAIHASSGTHPATDYRAIVRNAAAFIRMSSSPLTHMTDMGISQASFSYPNRPAPIASESPYPSTAATHQIDGDAALQSLFDMMAESGMEWSANLMSSAPVEGGFDMPSGFDFAFGGDAGPS